MRSSWGDEQAGIGGRTNQCFLGYSITSVCVSNLVVMKLARVINAEESAAMPPWE